MDRLSNRIIGSSRKKRKKSVVHKNKNTDKSSTTIISFVDGDITLYVTGNRILFQSYEQFIDNIRKNMPAFQEYPYHSTGHTFQSLFFVIWYDIFKFVFDSKWERKFNLPKGLHDCEIFKKYFSVLLIVSKICCKIVVHWKKWLVKPTTSVCKIRLSYFIS